MTELEKAFIRKEYEKKTVADNTHIRNAFYNAYINANRKKNQRFIELFKKQKFEKADKEYNLNAMKIIEKMEERDGKDWVRKVYAAAGIKKVR